VPLCAASLILFLVMNALEFFYFRRLSGGLPSLDMRVRGFAAEDATAWLSALGAAGREAILVWQYSSFDLVFPALFGLTLAGLALTAGARWPFFRRLSDRGQVGLALLLALPCVLAGYAQNLLIVRMLSNPATATIGMVSVASALVTAKFLLALLAMIAVAILFLGRRAHA
jgi:hypothetical protein